MIHLVKYLKMGSSSSIGPHEFDDFSSYMEDLEEIPTDYTFVFESFDDVIGLAKKLDEAELQTSLYFYEEKYYLHIVFDFDITEFEVSAKYIKYCFRVCQ